MENIKQKKYSLKKKEFTCAGWDPPSHGIIVSWIIEFFSIYFMTFLIQLKFGKKDDSFKILVKTKVMKQI